MAVKFQRLRRRLDQLGYRQPLPLEALPLAERLFADLIATTESLRNVTEGAAEKKAAEREEGRGTVVGAERAELYKADNARLVKVSGNGAHGCGCGQGVDIGVAVAVGGDVGCVRGCGLRAGMWAVGVAVGGGGTWLALSFEHAQRILGR